MPGKIFTPSYDKAQLGHHFRNYMVAICWLIRKLTTTDNTYLIYNNSVHPVLCEDWHIYWSVENTWRTASFQSSRREVWAHKKLDPSTFYRNACTRSGKWAVMCMCVKDIDFDYVSTIRHLDFGNVPIHFFYDTLTVYRINNKINSEG